MAAVNASLSGFFEEAQEAVGRLSEVDDWAEEKSAAALEGIEKLKGKVEQLKGEGALEDSSFSATVAFALSAVDQLKEAYSDTTLAAYHGVAVQSLEATKTLLTSVVDNPGKRVVSMGVGCALGYVFAGLVGLDAIGAAAGQTDQSGPRWAWGVALTGLLLGLGSNPTHEVIRAIQEYKASRRIAQPTA